MAKREKERERKLKDWSMRVLEGEKALRVCVRAACDCVSNWVYIYQSCVAQDFFSNPQPSALVVNLVNPFSNSSTVATLTNCLIPKSNSVR